MVNWIHGSEVSVPDRGLTPFSQRSSLVNGDVFHFELHYLGQPRSSVFNFHLHTLKQRDWGPIGNIFGYSQKKSLTVKTFNWITFTDFPDHVFSLVVFYPSKSNVYGRILIWV